MSRQNAWYKLYNLICSMCPCEASVPLCFVLLSVTKRRSAEKDTPRKQRHLASESVIGQFIFRCPYIVKHHASGYTGTQLPVNIFTPHFNIHGYSSARGHLSFLNHIWIICKHKYCYDAFLSLFD